MPARVLLISILFFTAGILPLGAGAAEPGVRPGWYEGRPVVDVVFVNQHGRYRFLLDTGTSLNHFDPKKARGIGVLPTFRTEVQTATGKVAMLGADGLCVTVEGIRSDAQMFLLGGTDALHQLSPDIDGILGQSFLSEFDYLIDVEARRLVFGVAEPAGTRMPLRSAAGRPAIDTNLGRMVLDSGSHRPVLFNVVTTSDTQEFVTMSGTVTVGTVAREIKIDGRTFWRGFAIGLPSSEAGLAGLLPLSIFKRVYISNSQGFVVVD